MNVFTTPSGHMSIDLDRIVAIKDLLNISDCITVITTTPDAKGGMCEFRVYYRDGAAILEAYQNQKETTDGS